MQKTNQKGAWRLGISALCLSLFSFVLNDSARADRALVVGINQYPNIKGADLQGAINDATDVAATLEKRGFRVTKLTDGAATKTGILGALSGFQQSVQSGERVVFYFAGHGTKHTNGKGALVVSDSKQEEITDPTADELGETLKTLKAKCKSVTVLLDSCFSGAMSRSFGRGGYRRQRLLRRAPVAMARAKDFVLTDADPIEPETVNGADNTNLWDSGGKSGICYFTAATGKQVAEENDLFGKARGIFSYFLTAQLKDEAQTATFGRVQMAVSAKVKEKTDGLQQPTISAAFWNTPLFESNAPAADVTPPAPPIKSEIWELYGANRSDASKVRVAMTPDKAPIKIGEKFRFDTMVGASGYLVVLERGTSGSLKLLFPSSRSAADAKVAAGQVVPIPRNTAKAFTADQVGVESVKAILFSDEMPVIALLSKFSVSKDANDQPTGLPFLDLEKGGRDFVEVDLDDWFTSDLTLQIVKDQD